VTIRWKTLAVVASVLGGPARADLTAPSEAILKIEFIERFPLFVEWPAEALGPRQPLFIVCIAGTGAVADALPQAAAFERFKGKPIAFRRVRAGDQLDMCHLVFLAAGEERNLPAYVSASATHPVLTVADFPGAASRGALIGFYREGERVRFEINRAAVDRSGLKLSSRLMSLARLVGTAEKAQGN
jgi:hypothetical protein